MTDEGDQKRPVESCGGVARSCLRWHRLAMVQTRHLAHTATASLGPTHFDFRGGP